MDNIGTVRSMWSRSRSLTAIFFLMVVLLVFNLAGLVFDSRQITGAPAWLKPAKFASSVAIFSGTIVWLLPYLSSFFKQARWAARVIAGCLLIEMVVIDGQAARGVSSHFNFATPLDGALFITMASAILVLWLGTLWLCVLLFLQAFRNRAFGWALRLGMTITVAGALTGSMMTRPTTEQRAAFRSGEKPKIVGAHTVGGPDGEKGLPGVNWSKTHGDLRIPHFLGLHGLQIVPLLYAFAIRPRSPERAHIPFVLIAAGSYAGLVVLLCWQALRGQSIVRPDSTTIVWFSIWALTTVAGFAVVRLGTRSTVLQARA